MACAVFSGWGQTKVMEDLLQKLRNRESVDVSNQHISCVHQYAAMRDMDCIANHKRKEMDTSPGDIGTKQPPKSTFNAQNHLPNIEPLPLVQKATWPTLTPQGFK